MVKQSGIKNRNFANVCNKNEKSEKKQQKFCTFQIKCSTIKATGKKKGTKFGQK